MGLTGGPSTWHTSRSASTKKAMTGCHVPHYWPGCSQHSSWTVRDDQFGRSSSFQLLINSHTLRASTSTNQCEGWYKISQVDVSQPTSSMPQNPAACCASRHGVNTDEVSTQAMAPERLPSQPRHMTAPAVSGTFTIAYRHANDLGLDINNFRRRTRSLRKAVR